MIVADEHDVDAREILQANPRASSAPRAYPRKRARPLRPDRVVKMLESLCWRSTVEWFTRVVRSSLPSTWRGGMDGSTSETNLGDGSGRLVSFHRKTSSNPRACGASGL